MCLNDKRTNNARKSYNGVALDGADRVLAHLLLRFPVRPRLVWNQQTGHKFIYGNYQQHPRTNGSNGIDEETHRAA